MERRFWSVAYGACLAVALVAILATFTDYGITWDEPLHVEYGLRALSWYLTLGDDRRLFDFQNLYLYGALHDTLVAVAASLLPYDDFAISHLAGALFALLGAAGCYRLATEFTGHPRAGFLAALLLLTVPDWWQHAFSNPKDVPLAVPAIWSLVFLARLARQLPGEGAGPAGAAALPRWRTVVGYGLIMGSALGIRVASAVLFGAAAALLGVWLLRRIRAAGWGQGLAETRALALRLLLVPVIAYAIMLLAWPWALLDPLRHPVQALSEFSKFPLDFVFTFAGVPVRTTDLPWWYIPVGFAVKLPEPFLLGLLAAVAVVAHGLRRGLLRLDAVAIAGAILIPPASIMVANSVLYDGIRHLMFLVPPLAAVAGIALHRLAGALPPWPRRAGAALVAAGILATVLSMVRLHPYEGIYYNQLVGGVRGAAGRFELDYWGSAMSEAARRLARQVAEREGPEALARSYRIRVCGPPTSALYYLPRSWTGVPLGSQRADFYIAFTRGPCQNPPPGPEIIRIERDGLPLAIVRDLRPPPADAPASPPAPQQPAPGP